MGMGEGGKNVEKMTSLHFFKSKIMNLLVFSTFEANKCFRVLTPVGLYAAEWDDCSCSLCNFYLFLFCR